MATQKQEVLKYKYIRIKQDTASVLNQVKGMLYKSKAETGLITDDTVVKESLLVTLKKLQGEEQ
jgi:hypothetical protein